MQVSVCFCNFPVFINDDNASASEKKKLVASRHNDVHAISVYYEFVE